MKPPSTCGIRVLAHDYASATWPLRINLARGSPCLFLSQAKANMSRKYTLCLCYRWNEAESVGGGCWRKNDRMLNGFFWRPFCIRRERLTMGPKIRVYVVLLGRGYRERKRWNAQIIDAWFLHPSLIAALEFTRIDPT